MNDNVLRACLTAFGVGLVLLLAEKAKAKLAARAEREGRGILESLGYRLGRLWASAHRSYQRLLGW